MSQTSHLCSARFSRRFSSRFKIAGLCAEGDASDAPARDASAASTVPSPLAPAAAAVAVAGDPALLCFLRLPTLFAAYALCSGRQLAGSGAMGANSLSLSSPPSDADSDDDERARFAFFSFRSFLDFFSFFDLRFGSLSLDSSLAPPSDSSSLASLSRPPSRALSSASWASMSFRPIPARHPSACAGKECFPQSLGKSQ